MPETVAEHVAVCAVVIDEGDAETMTDVMIEAGAVTVIVAEPDLVGSWFDVAVQDAVPAPVGVKTPEELIHPPVAVQVTPALYVTVPVTIAVHVAVCVVVIDEGDADTETEVMSKVSVLLELPLPVAQPDNPASAMSGNVHPALCRSISHH